MINDSTAEFDIGRRPYSGSFGYFNGRIDSVGFWKRVLTSAERTALYNSGNGLEYSFPFAPTSTTYSVVSAGDQMTTSSWDHVDSVAVTETLNSQTINYSVSFDGRTTFNIYDSTASNNGWRPIARNNSGTWQYNSNTTAGVSNVTWTSATYNSQRAFPKQPGYPKPNDGNTAWGVTALQ